LPLGRFWAMRGVLVDLIWMVAVFLLVTLGVRALAGFGFDVDALLRAIWGF
jgi:hypothetical protein